MAVALLALVLLLSSVAPAAAAEVLLDGTGTESEAAADADIVDIIGNGNDKDCRWTVRQVGPDHPPDRRRLNIQRNIGVADAPCLGGDGPAEDH